MPSMAVFVSTSTEANFAHGCTHRMFGHVYYWGFSLTDNSAEFLRDTKKFWFQIVADGIFSVDSFFFLSGFLVTSGIFKVVSKGGRFPWAKYYIHRYLRLTPVYGFVFLIYSELAGYMESGPTWEPTTVSPACDTWWANLLYIQNLVPGDQTMCMNWSWYSTTLFADNTTLLFDAVVHYTLHRYLANDFQMYALTPLIALPLVSKPKLGLFLLFATLVATAAISFAIAWKNEVAGSCNRLFF
eukprot:m.376881 g.376881  ORF g.376881 m.376881 type:complete len:242 (-) comp56191_c0_seq1:894-1619(-)